MEEVKGFRKNFVILSVFYVIAGIILLFWPHMSVELFCRVLGIAMLVNGIAHIIIYFTKDHMMNVLQMDLTVGVICSAIGAFLLLHQEFVEMMLPFAVGILLLMGAIMKLQDALDLKRLNFKYWKLMLACSILCMILGAILIYNPFSEAILLIYIGVSLIIDGVSSIFSVLCISSIMKKVRKAAANSTNGTIDMIPDGKGGFRPAVTAAGTKELENKK